MRLYLTYAFIYRAYFTHLYNKVTAHIVETDLNFLFIYLVAIRYLYECLLAFIGRDFYTESDYLSLHVSVIDYVYRSWLLLERQTF